MSSLISSLVHSRRLPAMIGLASLLSVVSTANAWVDCPEQSGGVLLSCLTDNAMEINVCANNGQVRYVFVYGETEVKTPGIDEVYSADEVTYQPWSGVGSDIFESIILQGETPEDYYEVYSNYNRDINAEGSGISAGVNYYRDDVLLDELVCNTDIIDANLENYNELISKVDNTASDESSFEEDLAEMERLLREMKASIERMEALEEKWDLK